MNKQQIIGTLKNITVTSKVDDNNREVHTVMTKIELIENKGREYIQDIAKSLNKPIRIDFDAVSSNYQDIKINQKIK